MSNQVAQTRRISGGKLLKQKYMSVDRNFVFLLAFVRNVGVKT